MSTSATLVIATLGILISVTEAKNPTKGKTLAVRLQVDMHDNNEVVFKDLEVGWVPAYIAITALLLPLITPTKPTPMVPTASTQLHPTHYNNAHALAHAHAKDGIEEVMYHPISEKLMKKQEPLLDGS